MIKESAGPESEKPAEWNRWFQEAQDGNNEAAHHITVAALPIIDSLSKDPLFRNRLGTEEVYSIAYYTLVKFIKSHNKLPDDAEVPFLLRCIIQRDLKDAVRVLGTKEQHEQLARPAKPKETVTDDGYTDDGCSEAADTDNSAEPETHILNSELCDSVREAVQQLPERERTVIHALYYQNKDMKEIAQDLHCSFQFVYKTRRSAYTHLRKMLKETVYV